MQRQQAGESKAQYQREAGQVGDGEQQECVAPVFLSQEAPRFSPGTEHQQDQAELIKKAHDRAGAGREQEKLGVRRRRQHLQHEWPKQDARDNLSHNARLLEPLGNIAKAVHGDQKYRDGEHESDRTR